MFLSFNIAKKAVDTTHDPIAPESRSRFREGVRTRSASSSLPLDPSLLGWVSLLPALGLVLGVGLGIRLLPLLESLFSVS